MDHADAVELIELAAVEPDGLERLMAGDTPESAAVAGHLAGCPECVAGMARIRRTASVLREVVAQQPDPALRERTLAFVREVGRDRSSPVLEPRSSAVPVPTDAVVSPSAAGLPGDAVVPGDTAATGVTADVATPGAHLRVARQSSSRWAALGGIAAALVLAVGIGFGAARVTAPQVTAPQVTAPPDESAAREIAVLQGTTEAMLRLEAQPDTRRITLSATTAGAGSAGALLFSPSTGELVMIATGLTDLSPGEEYGCWVEVGGERTRIGKMYAGGELQSWAGPVDGLDNLPPDAVFGVSLVPADGRAGEPQLTGGL